MSVHISINLEKIKDAVDAVELIKTFLQGISGTDSAGNIKIAKNVDDDNTSRVVLGGISKVGDQKPASSNTPKTEQTSSGKTGNKAGAEKPGESGEFSEDFLPSSKDTEGKTTELSEPDPKKPDPEKPATKEKVSEKKQRRAIATQKADELGIPWTTKTGTAAIEKLVVKAEETSGTTEFGAAAGKDVDDMIPGRKADGKKAGKKASKKKMYKAKDVKALCYRYIQDNPVQGDTDEKKTALYGDILEKYGEAKKMSEIEANGNLQIVGEVLAAHIAYWDVVTAVSEHAATSAVVLITNQEDLTEIPPMLHVPVLEALLTVLVAVDEKE